MFWPLETIVRCSVVAGEAISRASVCQKAKATIIAPSFEMLMSWGVRGVVACIFFFTSELVFRMQGVLLMILTPAIV